jgi:hypothetical protein
MPVAKLNCVYETPRPPQKPRWLEYTGWIATVIAVTGVLLNNHMCRYCFLTWLVSNSLTLAIHVKSRLWALGVRDVIFLGLAVDGWLRWTR